MAGRASYHRFFYFFVIEVTAIVQYKMEAEGQRLLVQLEDIIRDFGELEKRWEGPDPEPELTLSRTYEIQHS